MKNTIKLFGIVAIVAVIGLSMMACGGDDAKDQTVIVKNLSKWSQDDTVKMVLTKVSAPSGQYLAGPREITKTQQWKVTGCPIGEELTVIVIDDNGLGFGTPAFTLAAGETKTLIYRGGGSYATGPESDRDETLTDDFTVTND